ncbi:MAG TPA: outer membrane protein assembly factor BamC [Methylococcales bacterium]
MQAINKSLLLTIMLVSCGGNDSRYRDTQMLERPPTLAVSKKAGEEPRIIDNSTIPKKRDETGLGSDVYMIESAPMQLRIKKPVDYAWQVLGMALKQSHIKIIDHRQDKGLYYVYYKQKSLFDSAVSLFKKNQENDEHHEANYELTVKEDKAETKVSATPLNAAEQDSYDNAATSDAEALLWLLYKTLHDDLKEE